MIKCSRVQRTVYSEPCERHQMSLKISQKKKEKKPKARVTPGEQWPGDTWWVSVSYTALWSHCSSSGTQCTWSCSGTCSQRCIFHHICSYTTWIQLERKGEKNQKKNNKWFITDRYKSLLCVSKKKKRSYKSFLTCTEFSIVRTTIIVTHTGGVTLTRVITVSAVTTATLTWVQGVWIILRILQMQENAVT